MSKIEATSGAIEAAENYGININLVPPAKAGKKITAADVDAYAKALKKGDAPATDAPAEDSEKDDAPAIEEKPAKKRKKDLICVFAIKEGGKLIPAGSVYEGKNAEYLLSKGAIKED